jgi:hypothetical protein
MHRDLGFVPPEEVPRPEIHSDPGARRLLPHELALIQDLELDTLLRAMAISGVAGSRVYPAADATEPCSA